MMIILCTPAVLPVALASDEIVVNMQLLLPPSEQKRPLIDELSIVVEQSFCTPTILYAFFELSEFNLSATKKRVFHKSSQGQAPNLLVGCVSPQIALTKAEQRELFESDAECVFCHIELSIVFHLRQLQSFQMMKEKDRPAKPQLLNHIQWFRNAYPTTTPSKLGLDNSITNTFQASSQSRFNALERKVANLERFVYCVETQFWMLFSILLQISVMLATVIVPVPCQLSALARPSRQSTAMMTNMAD